MDVETNTLTCRLCGTPVSGQIWDGAECPRCHSVNCVELPSEDELAEFYASFIEKYTGGGRKGNKNQIRYARRYLKLVRKYRQSGNLIDVGPATNPFANLAAQAGFEATVADYERPSTLDPGVEYLVGNLNNDSILESHAQQYDVVTAWAVIEHVRIPRLAVKLLAGLASPGGIICLTTPEIGTVLTNHSIGHSGWFIPPEHLHLISPQAHIELFAEEGCRLLDWGRFELNMPRFIARYGIGAAETAAGMPLKLLLPGLWRDLRANRRHRFKGITYFVFESDAASR